MYFFSITITMNTMKLINSIVSGGGEASVDNPKVPVVVGRQHMGKGFL